jgi:hypothetical protein
MPYSRMKEVLRWEYLCERQGKANIWQTYGIWQKVRPRRGEVSFKSKTYKGKPPKIQ